MSDPHDHIILARDCAHPAARADLDRALRHDRIRRLAEGAYVGTPEWEAADDAARHLLRAAAQEAIRRRRLVFSHWTAIAAWGLPMIEAYPDEAHVVADRSSGGRSDDGLRRHTVGLPSETQRRHGLEVTTLARSLVDLARVAPFAVALAAADAAVRADPNASDALIPELPPPGSRGAARARRVVAAADGGSESPGESLSRASMIAAGIPLPELQAVFEDESGVMRVDFWWPRAGIIGEFDGMVKYDDPVMRAGRSTRDVVLAEKRREDRLRALGPRVVRWGWAEARSPNRLAARLRAAGLRDERYRNW